MTETCLWVGAGRPLTAARTHTVPHIQCARHTATHTHIVCARHARKQFSEPGRKRKDRSRGWKAHEGVKYTPVMLARLLQPCDEVAWWHSISMGARGLPPTSWEDREGEGSEGEGSEGEGSEGEEAKVALAESGDDLIEVGTGEVEEWGEARVGRYNTVPLLQPCLEAQPRLPNPAAPCNHPLFTSLRQASSLDVVLEVAVGASPLHGAKRASCEALASTPHKQRNGSKAHYPNPKPTAVLFSQATPLPPGTALQLAASSPKMACSDELDYSEPDVQSSAYARVLLSFTTQAEPHPLRRSLRGRHSLRGRRRRRRSSSRLRRR